MTANDIIEQLRSMSVVELSIIHRACTSELQVKLRKQAEQDQQLHERLEKLKASMETPQLVGDPTPWNTRKRR